MNNDLNSKVNYNTGTSSSISWRNNKLLKVLSILYFLNFLVVSWMVLAEGDDCYEFCITSAFTLVSLLPFFILLLIFFIIRRKTVDKLDKVFLWIILFLSLAFVILTVSVKSYDIGRYLDKQYIQWAVKNKDVTLCDRVSKINQDWCRSDVAKSVNSPSLCVNINSVDNRDDCYSHIAYNLKDPSICDKITVPSKRDYCLNSIR